MAFSFPRGSLQARSSEHVFPELELPVHCLVGKGSAPRAGMFWNKAEAQLRALVAANAAESLPVRWCVHVTLGSVFTRHWEQQFALICWPFCHSEP